MDFFWVGNNLSSSYSVYLKKDLNIPGFALKYTNIIYNILSPKAQWELKYTWFIHVF